MPAGIDVLNNILRYHINGATTGNKWNVDFTLHSTYADAVSGANPWACWNGQFKYKMNSDGECSPSGARVHNKYTNWWWGHGPQLAVA